MPLYLTQGRYTSESFRALVAKPEDRTEEVGKLIAAAGGKLHSFYYTLGEYDFMLISEAPSEREPIAALLTAAASGTVTDLKTTTMISPADMKQCCSKAGSIAGKFRPIGK